MRFARLSFLAAATLTAFAVASTMPDSRLSLQCKNIARDVIMNSCKGPRPKRSAELLDGEQEAAKPDVGQSPVDQQKRHVYLYVQPRNGAEYRRGYGYGFPGENYMSESFHQTGLGLPGFGFMDTSMSEVVEDRQRPYPMPMPYRPMGYPMRSASPDDLLGFNLSSDELEELHEEIGGRMARNSKALNKKIFQHVAAKCCSNARLCYDNPSVIPCMGY